MLVACIYLYEYVLFRLQVDLGAFVHTYVCMYVPGKYVIVNVYVRMYSGGEAQHQAAYRETFVGGVRVSSVSFARHGA